MGGREKQRQLGRGNDEYLEEKTPGEIIEERKQRLRTSRMDTRLRTPFPRRKGWAGGKRKQLRIELGKDEEVRVDLTRNAPDKRAEEQRSESQLRDHKESLKGKRSNSKHIRQDS